MVGQVVYHDVERLLEIFFRHLIVACHHIDVAKRPYGYHLSVVVVVQDGLLSQALRFLERNEEVVFVYLVCYFRRACEIVVFHLSASLCLSCQAFHSLVKLRVLPCYVVVVDVE